MIYVAQLHLSEGDFEVIQHVVKLLCTGCYATKTLSAKQSQLGDVIPAFSSLIEALKATDVPTSASRLKSALIHFLQGRLKMLMECEFNILYRSHQIFSSHQPNDLVFVSYLAPSMHQR